MSTGSIVYGQPGYRENRRAAKEELKGRLSGKWLQPVLSKRERAEINAKRKAAGEGPLELPPCDLCGRAKCQGWHGAQAHAERRRTA